LQGVVYRCVSPSGYNAEGRPAWAPRRNAHIAAAPAAGPVAIVSSHAEIYSPLGRPSLGPLQLPSRPLAAGFLSDDTLAMPMLDGSIHLLSTRHPSKSITRTTPSSARPQHPNGIHHASVASGVVACVLNDGNVLLLELTSDCRWHERLVDGPPDDPHAVHARCVFSHASSSSVSSSTNRSSSSSSSTSAPQSHSSSALSRNAADLLVGTANEIIACGNRQLRQSHTLGPLVSLACPPGRSGPVALASSSGPVAVLSSSLQERLATIREEHASPPAAMCWCGADAVLAAEPDGSLSLLGPTGSEVTAETQGVALAVLPEADGARVLTPEGSVLVSRVPKALEEALGIGSAFPAALLVDALRQFDQRSPKAHHALRVAGSAKGGLRSAAMRCCEAALHALAPADQRLLLRAASHGAAFCDDDKQLPKGHINDTCRRARVLNALRRPHEGGMPITHNQLESFADKESGAIRRLVSLRRHLLALRLASFLSLSEGPILRDWAVTRAEEGTRRGESNEALAFEILARIGKYRNAPFAEVAAEAHELGRPLLAAEILDHERSAGKQVPLLSSLGEHARAVARAEESGEPDLIYLCIFNAWHSLSFNDLCNILQSHFAARSLYRTFCLNSDPESLKSFYYYRSDWCGMAELALREAFSPVSVEDAGRSSARLLDKAAELFGRSRDSRAKACEDAARVIRAQGEVQYAASKTGQGAAASLPTFVGEPLCNTLYRLLLGGHFKAAGKLRSDLRVPDKLFAWIRTRALIERRDWRALEDAVQADKRTAVPPQDLVDMMEEAAAPVEEMSKHVARIGDAGQRALCYSRLGLEEEAKQAGALAGERAASLQKRLQGLLGLGPR